MKKYLIFGILFSTFIANTALSSELPMFPIKNEADISKKTSYPQNYYNNNLDNFQNYYFNYRRCYGYNCWYSTTLTTNELRARADEKRKARLEAKCKANKARKSKCKELMED